MSISEFNDFSMSNWFKIQWFFHFYKFQELFMKFNDFSMILKQIWISMIFQELWEPWDCNSHKNTIHYRYFLVTFRRPDNIYSISDPWGWDIEYLWWYESLNFIFYGFHYHAVRNFMLHWTVSYWLTTVFIGKTQNANGYLIFFKTSQQVNCHLG